MEADGADEGNEGPSEGRPLAGGPLPMAPQDGAFFGGSSANGAVGAKPRRSRWPIVVAAVVVVLVVVGGVGIVAARTSGAISTGNGTATFTWTSASPSENTSSSNGVFQIPPQPFSGEINGIAVSGVSTAVTKNLSSLTAPRTKPSNVEIFQYKGSFDGRPFDIGLFVRLTPTGSPLVSNGFVKGSYDGDPVNGVVGEPSSGRPGGSKPAHFHGTIGDYKVSGSSSGPQVAGRRR